jgi:hypothetical protein
MLIVVLGSTVVALCAHLLQLSSADLSSERARFAAESGLAYAMEQIQLDEYWSSGLPKTKMPQRPDCSFSVNVWNNITGSGSAVVAGDGTAVEPGSVYIQALGSDGRLQRTISALYQFVDFVGFGMQGMTIDLYSTVQSAASGTASAGTNGTVSGAMTVDGTIQGFAYVGAAGAGVAGPYASFGGFKTLPAPVKATVPTAPLPAVTTPDFIYGNTTVGITPGSYHELNLTSVTLQMQPGTYFFSGDVFVGGVSSIVVTPPGTVTMYVDDVLTVQDTTQLNPGGSGAFYLFGTQNVGGMTFAGYSVSYLNGYAPTSAITVKDHAEVIGSLFGNLVTLQDEGVLTRNTRNPQSVLQYIKL